MNSTSLIFATPWRFIRVNPRKSVAQFFPSHAIVIRPAAAFGLDPGDDLVRILNVAGLAVYAVRGIQADAFAIRGRGVVEHLVNIGRAEMLAGTAEFANAT